MIQITIDPETFNEAVVKAVNEGLTNGVNSYAIKQAIATAAQEAIQASPIVAMCREAVQASLAEQAKDITRQVAAVAVPAVTKALVQGYTASAVETLYGLRRGAGYMTSEDEAKLRAEVWREVRGDNTTALKEAGLGE